MSEMALATRDDSRLSFSYTEAANKLRDDALAMGALVGTISNGEQQQVAVDAQKEITRILGLIEKARVAAKEPVLNFGRKIDDTAKAFISELKAEQLRIATKVGDFQQLEQARIRAAEQVRLAEERKLEEERRAAERKAYEEAAAAKRKLDEEAAAIAQKAREATTKMEKARAEQERIELERQRALADAKSHEELDRINAAHAQQVASLPVEQVQKSVGQKLTDDWEVTVSDIHMLYRAHPNCVELNPRISEIKGLLKMGVAIKGVVAKPIVKSGVTGSRQPAAIEV